MALFVELPHVDFKIKCGITESFHTLRADSCDNDELYSISTPRQTSKWAHTEDKLRPA